MEGLLPDLEVVRKDFPILSRVLTDGRPLVYLDSANTSQKPQVVIDTMVDHLERHNANIARAMHQLGAEATAAYEDARDKVAAFLGAPDRDEVVFTKNASEALNLAASTLAWPGVPANGSYKLFYAANGGLAPTPGGALGLSGADSVFDLTVAALPDAIRQKYPHLAGATGLTLSAVDAAKVAAMVSGQFAIAQYDGAGNLVQVTSLQTAGLLDDLYAAQAAQAQLGVTFDRNGLATFRVWAPTAKSVALNLYASADAATGKTVPMTLDAASGVWRATSTDPQLANRAYYTYTVQVLSRWADNKIVTNTVTDPYSLSLSANSARSFAANLDSAQLKPAGWDDQRIPKLDAPTDIALYELHIRDFSASDATVPAAHRGK